MPLLLQGPPGHRRNSARELLAGLGFTIQTEDSPASRFGEVSLQVLEGKRSLLQIHFYGQGYIRMGETIGAHISGQGVEFPLFTPFLEKLPYPRHLPNFQIEHHKGKSPAVYLISQSRYLVSADIFGEAGALLYFLGNEGWSRDSHQRLADRAHLPHQLGFPEKAVVNRVAQFILELLSLLCSRHGIALPRLLPWPNSSPMAAAITFDLDLFRPHQRISSFLEPLYHLYKRDFKELPRSLISLPSALSAGNRIHFNLESIFSSLSQAGAQATFFLASAHAGQRHPLDPDYHLDEPVARQSIIAIKKNSGEIALHSGYQALYDEKKLRAQKNYLQAVTGEQIRGNRTHYLRLKYPQSFHLLTQGGFSYDSSLSFSTTAGFRTGYCLPFFPLLIAPSRQVLEMAPMVMDTVLFHRLGLDSKRVQVLVEQLTEEVRRSSGLGIYIFHDFYCGEDFREMQATFQHILKRLNRAGAWMAPLGEINNWWRKRAGVTLQTKRKNRGWETIITASENVEGLSLTFPGMARGKVTGRMGNERFSQRYSADQPLLLPPLKTGEVGILLWEGN
jgi:peptidoglycan/xylan/chitin deacetylase (PgdA/CDA1 family)